MGNLKIGWLATGALAIAIVVAAVLIYPRFRRDIRAAQERLQTGGSQVIESDCGPIEYATLGEGYPVLVVHGIFGGFDQGLVTARRTVPVLIINAVDDPLALYENAQSMAERIPDARLVTIESGGHMLLGHEERIRSEIVAFLEEYSSTRP